MEMLAARLLEGTNRWFRDRTAVVRVANVPDGDCRGPAGSLARAIEALPLPPALSGVAGDFRAALKDDPSWPRLVAELAGTLQLASGDFRGDRAATPADEPGTADVALVAEEFPHGVACLREAIDLANRLLAGESIEPELAEAVARLVDVADETCLGGTIGPMLVAARDRRIPISRIDDNALVQLGEGVHQQRIKPATTAKTGWIAEQISCDKAYVKTLWDRSNVPVAAGRLVFEEADAIATALEVGWPVAVKPPDADYGIGVTLGVGDVEGVCAAFRKAKERSGTGGVLVEHNLKGLWHRLLVVNDELVAAARREPPSVVGDGRSKLADLVEAENARPERGPNYRWPLQKLVIDDHAVGFLAEQGLTLESVPEAGRTVVLRKFAYTEYGAVTRDMLDIVHPSTRDHARDAVKLVGLDMAGLDVIAEDLSIPLRQQDGGFLEINASPMITLHIAPICSNPRPVGEKIVQMLFPAPSQGRVPLIVVIGDESAKAVAEASARGLRALGFKTALSTAEATCWEDRPLTPQGPTTVDRLKVMTFYPRTEAAVFAITPADLFAHGLGTDRCTAVILPDGPEALGPWWGPLKQSATAAIDGRGKSAEDLAAEAVAGLL
ncbi:MAG: hypothetical protein U0800_13465 [Isosphaeraceae bacterium]